MPFEVFSLFYRCASIHGVHQTLEEAARCFSDIRAHNGGQLRVNPISQKYIHTIVKIDKDGNRIEFSKEDQVEAARLHLDPKSIMERVPGITTFSHLAKLYYEAARWLPISAFNLKAIFEPEKKGRMFWTTDAGQGQALAYAHQAIFTLELSLKAVLEVLGKLREENRTVRNVWQTHNLIALFNLLEESEKKLIEDWWVYREDTTKYEGTLTEFLSEYNDLNVQWRYLTDQKTVNISLDVRRLTMAALFLIRASDSLWRERSPLNIEITVNPVTHDADAEASLVPEIKHGLLKGRIRTVNVPEGFDPHTFVEVTVDPEQEEGVVTVRFLRRFVEEYFGLKEGDEVVLSGYYEENEPRILDFSKYIDGSPKKGRYTFEDRTLCGFVYDLRHSLPAMGYSSKVILSLYVETYYCVVDCLFITKEDREKLEGLHLNDKILITGKVTSLDGKPVTLVNPTSIERTD